MYAEIYTAVSFLSGFLYNKLPRRKVNLFSAQLANDLVVRFTSTWNTNEPHKGAELRKLNVKARGVVDTLISVTALNVGLNLEEVLLQFPGNFSNTRDSNFYSGL
uniref:Anti-proliferative protein domain-containing protein n=1 Tax=Romanomermis culicivorax TaxID=13658 RepID=A0A915JRB0_ROMCU